MKLKQQRSRHDPFGLSEDEAQEMGALTRNSTIQQSDLARQIDECPLTLRGSVSAWSGNELQPDFFIHKEAQLYHADGVNVANTPRYHVLSVQSSGESDRCLETVHNRKNLYGCVSGADATEVLHRPTISLGEINKEIEFETVLYEPLHDEKLRHRQQSSISTAATYRFEQPRPLWHFVNAVTSDEVYRQAEDWGIDRSIYTRYARVGFFADCHMADLLHHGEYLNLPECEAFAECRMPLILCIISTGRETRLNEVQRGIVPLAVNLLDRYIVKHKHSMSRLVSIAYAHSDGSTSESSSKQGSLASSLTARDIACLDSSAGAGKAAHAGGGFNHDNLIKLCFKFSSEDRFAGKDDGADHGALARDTDSCYDGASDAGAPGGNHDNGLVLKFDVIYNFIAAACFFIADRYNGLSNTSVKALLYKWESVCHIFTKTRDAARYIRDNRAVALSIIMSFMFDIYFVLEYKLTTPFPCNMIQDLIMSTTDFQCSQNPADHNLYQNLAAILARIAYVDDTFHRFTPSVITLAIYSVVRRFAVHNQTVDDGSAWLLVDEGDLEIRGCSTLLVKTLLQYVGTDILDVLTQPVYMKLQREELFSYVFVDLGDLDIVKLRNVANTLTTLC